MRKKVKTIRSHAGYARFLHGCGRNLGYIPRDPSISTPYTSGPTHVVFEDCQGRPVIVAETGQRCYEVFVVEPCEIFRQEKEATEVFVERWRREHPSQIHEPNAVSTVKILDQPS